MKNHQIVILKLLGILVIIVGNALNNIDAEVIQPVLPVANEVNFNDSSTATVNDGQGFLDAYKNTDISRITFTKDIDVSTTDITTSGFRATLLSRSLQIDGQGHKLTATLNNGPNNYPFFRMNTTIGSTFHLKDLTVIAGGQNMIDDQDVASRSTNWHVILDNVSFPKDTSVAGNGAKTREPNRVLRMRRGHLFFRNKVEMYTNAENMYIGQVTAEKNAEIVAEINHYDYSTWWFVDTASNGMINFGEGSKVFINGVGGATYPTIYQNYKTINVHKDASFKATKPGPPIRFDTTAGVTSKYLSVFEGATLEVGSSADGLLTALINTVGTGYSVNIYAGPNAKVLAVAKSTTDATALINLPNNGSTFELERTGYYDLRNNRTSSPVVRVGTGGSVKFNKTDTAVWKKGIGINLDGQPNNSWQLGTVIADSNGDSQAGTDAEIASLWKTTDYSRITGLNAHPELKVREITDADKSFIIETQILDKIAWTNEVNIKVTDNKSENAFNGKNNIEGMYKQTMNDFYQAGATVTATGTRGATEWSTLNPQAMTIVKDVTPPIPAQVSETIFSNASKISGKSDEPGAKVTLDINDAPILDDAGQPLSTNANEAGEWTIDLPVFFQLQDKDIIQIFLTDTAGNTNPKVDTTFKDAIFLAGSKIKVEKDSEIVNPPVKPGVDEAGKVDQESGFGIWVKPADFSFADIKASDHAQSIAIQGDSQRLISVVDTSGRKSGWTLEANMSTPTSVTDGNEKLTGAMIDWKSEVGVHFDPENNLSISDTNEVSAPREISLTEDYQKIMSAAHGKGEGYYGLLMNNIHLVILANSGKTDHSYKMTINWALNDVPAP